MKYLFSLTLALLTACSTLPTKHPDSITNRDFREIERRIQKLKGVDWKAIATISHNGENFPIYVVTTRPKKGSKNIKNIFLTGGVHGDEPAGVFSLLEFLEVKAKQYENRFRFFVIPLVNPVGFQLNTLENGKQENINRSFTKSISVLEAKAIEEQLAEWKTQFAFTMDMHEIPYYWEGEGWTQTDNPHTAYLYETQVAPSQRIGAYMMKRLPGDIEVCNWPTIYADIAKGGVVTYPEGNKNAVYAQGTTLDAYLQGRYSTHTFTNETPIGWPIEKRVKTHLAWLAAALEKK